MYLLFPKRATPLSVRGTTTIHVIRFVCWPIRAHEVRPLLGSVRQVHHTTVGRVANWWFCNIIRMPTQTLDILYLNRSCRICIISLHYEVNVCCLYLAFDSFTTWLLKVNHTFWLTIIISILIHCDGQVIIKCTLIKKTKRIHFYCLIFYDTFLTFIIICQF